VKRAAVAFATLLAFVPAAAPAISPAGLLVLAPPLSHVPAPSPSPSEKPLLEIGRVRATTPFCRKMADQASGAVDTALFADRQIVSFSAALRKVDLDSSQLAKYRGTEDVRKRYASLRATAVEGERQLKLFREEAKAAETEEQRVALVSFADALGGAVFRQKKLAEDLGRYLAFLDASEPLSEEDHDRIQKAILANAGNPAAPHDPFGDLNMVPETLSHSARGAADELDLRALAIGKDEDVAADRIDAAFKGC
jgi:hypothetical protein